MEPRQDSIKGTILETAYNLGAQTDNGRNELIGYSIVRKTQCEIFNFISPTLRILRFTEGRADWRIAGRVCRFARGDVVVLNNLVKRNIDRVHTPYITYEMFNFFPAVFSSSQLWKVFYQEEHLAGAPDLPGYDRTTQLLDQLRDEITGEDLPHKSLCIRNLLNLLAIQFSRVLGDGDVADGAIFKLSESIQFLMEHLAEDISVTDLANICAYTPEYYARQFKRYIGISPIQYIINSRIETVMQLARSRQMTIMDAALQTGFRTSSAFYKSFRAYRGMTPTQYLKQLDEAEQSQPKQPRQGEIFCRSR